LTFLGAVCEDGIGGVVAEESADTLSELLRRFAICRCGIPGRQRRCVVEVSVVTQLELTAMFGIPRRGMSGRQRLCCGGRVGGNATGNDDDVWRLSLLQSGPQQRCTKRSL